MAVAVASVQGVEGDGSLGDFFIIWALCLDSHGRWITSAWRVEWWAAMDGGSHAPPRLGDRH